MRTSTQFRPAKPAAVLPVLQRDPAGIDPVLPKFPSATPAQRDSLPARTFRPSPEDLLALAEGRAVCRTRIVAMEAGTAYRISTSGTSFCLQVRGGATSAWLFAPQLPGIGGALPEALGVLGKAGRV